MKLNRVITMCGVAAALLLSASTLFAQDNNGGDNGGGGRRRGGGQGGGGGGGFGGGNFDPAQFQQRMMDNYRERLAFTNDTEWSAVQPLIQKVTDARLAIGFGGRGFGGGRGGRGGGQGGNGGGGGGAFGQPNPEREALQKAVDDDAPSAQISDLLKKYQTAQKERQAKLESAQGDLRKVLSKKQEAEATLLGLLP